MSLPGTITRRAMLPLLAGIPFSRVATPEAMPRASETRLLFGGDVMLSRFVGRLARQQRDPAWSMRDLAPVFSAADIAFVNLEAPFSDIGKPVEAGMIFKAEPEMVETLKLGGIDIVSTANNHARDCNGHGVEYTLDWLDQNDIAAVGTAKSAEGAHSGVVLDRNGVRFGFLAYTYDQSNGNHTDVDDRVAALNVGRMRTDVANLLTRADVVVVSMHAGIEYALKPNAQQTGFAHSAIDAGARVVIGHHPHVVQPWEYYGSGVIFYSLGNLIFDQFQRVETQHGLLAEVIFTGKDMVRVTPMPVDIVRTVPRLSTMATTSAGSAAGASPGR